MAEIFEVLVAPAVTALSLVTTAMRTSNICLAAEVPASRKLGTENGSKSQLWGTGWAEKNELDGIAEEVEYYTCETLDTPFRRTHQGHWSFLDKDTKKKQDINLWEGVSE